MTTLAADRSIIRVVGPESSIGIVASDIVYEGAMVGDNTAGYGRPLVAGDKFVGHAIKKVDNASGAAGAKNIPLLSQRYRLDVLLTGLITDVGNPVYASDDSVVTFAASGNSYVGVITRYVSATRMEVEFRPGEEDEFGPNQFRDLKTDDYTIDALDNGKIIYLGTDTKTITLFAVSVGYQITIVNPAADGGALITIDPDGADLIKGGTDLAAGADGAALTNTKATQNRFDFVTLVGEATGWNIIGRRGVWAQA